MPGAERRRVIKDRVVYGGSTSRNIADANHQFGLVVLYILHTDTKGMNEGVLQLDKPVAAGIGEDRSVIAREGG